MNIQKIAKIVKEEEIEYFNKIETSYNFLESSNIKPYLKGYGKTLISLCLPLSILESFLSVTFFDYSLSQSIVIFFISTIFFSMVFLFNYKNYIIPQKKITKKEMIESFYGSIVSNKTLDILKVELNKEQYKVLKYSSINHGLTYYKLVDFLKNVDNVNLLIKNTSAEQNILDINNIQSLNIINRE